MCSERNAMSAFGYKRTYSGQLANVRFTPESGHSEAQERVGLKKRALDVRFAPKSGHKWLGRGMSAYDRNPTFMVLALFCEVDVSRRITASDLNQVVRWFIDIIIGSREIFGYRGRGRGWVHVLR